MVVIFATLCTGVIFIVESTTTLLGSGLNPIGSDVKEYGLYGILVLLLIERWSEIVKGNTKKVDVLELQLLRITEQMREMTLEMEVEKRLTNALNAKTEELDKK